MKHSRTLRLPAAAATIAVMGLAVTACGSSSNTGSASTSSPGSAAATAGAPSSGARSKFTACLKAHGVTLPVRPARARQRPPGGYGAGAHGGGAPGFFFGGGGNGGTGEGAGAPGARTFDNPKLRAALQACGGGRFTPRRSTANRAAVARFAACVKQHGYALPAPNFSGMGPIFPAAIARNKTFQAAARACASDLRPQGAPAGTAGGAPSAGGSASD